MPPPPPRAQNCNLDLDVAPSAQRFVFDGINPPQCFDNKSACQQFFHTLVWSTFATPDSEQTRGADALSWLAIPGHQNKSEVFSIKPLKFIVFGTHMLTSTSCCGVIPGCCPAADQHRDTFTQSAWRVSELPPPPRPSQRDPDLDCATSKSHLESKDVTLSALTMRQRRGGRYVTLPPPKKVPSPSSALLSDSSAQDSIGDITTVPRHFPATRCCSRARPARRAVNTRQNRERSWSIWDFLNSCCALCTTYTPSLKSQVEKG